MESVALAFTFVVTLVVILTARDVLAQQQHDLSQQQQGHISQESLQV